MSDSTDRGGDAGRSGDADRSGDSDRIGDSDRAGDAERADDADREDARGAASADTPLLAVEDIDTYYGQSHVLQGVSLDIPEGQVVTLVGRNGAGKTTTLRSIMGVTPPRSGTIRFRGTPIQGRDPHEVRRAGISWVPEDRRLFPMLTVEENLRLAASGTDGSTGFDRVYERFPRLDERREQKAGTMSGGEQQMLAIARALVGEQTDLMLLDEPTEGLAPQIVEDVADIVRTLNGEGVTVLLVEQNAKVALSLADGAYVIDSGQIVYEGPAADLRTDQQLMERYLGVK